MKRSYFIKSYDDSQQAQAEFERTLTVYNKVVEARPARLRIAKPIEVNNSKVCFERITGCVNLRKLICRPRVDTKILYYAGQALAELHLALNNRIDGLDGDMYIHGDFSASNVLYMPTTRLIYIVDFAPYCYDNSKSYHYGPAYRDLAHIVLTLEIKYPIYRIYLVLRKKNMEMSTRLWEGYEDTMDIKIDRKILYEHVIKQINSARALFRKRHRFSQLVWTKVFDQVKQRYINLRDS